MIDPDGFMSTADFARAVGVNDDKTVREIEARMPGPVPADLPDQVRNAYSEDPNDAHPVVTVSNCLWRETGGEGAFVETHNLEEQTAADVVAEWLVEGLKNS